MTRSPRRVLLLILSSIICRIHHVSYIIYHLSSIVAKVRCLEITKGCVHVVWVIYSLVPLTFPTLSPRDPPPPFCLSPSIPLLLRLFRPPFLFSQFWGFANDIVSVSEAKRFYPLFGLGANVALVFSGQYVR